jgi:hypothetical protein
MGIFNRKSQLQRVVESVGDSLDVPKGVKKLPSGGSGKAIKGGLIATGGLAALTAASAGISSLRRRGEGAGDS